MTLRRFILSSIGVVFVFGAPVMVHAEEIQPWSLEQEFKGDVQGLKEQQQDLNKKKKALRREMKDARKEHIEQRKENRAERIEKRKEHHEKLKGKRQGAHEKIKAYRGQHGGNAGGSESGVGVTSPEVGAEVDAKEVKTKSMKPASKKMRIAK